MVHYTGKDKSNGIVVPLRRADKSVRATVMAAILADMADHLEECPGLPAALEFPSWLVAGNPSRAIAVAMALSELDRAAAKLRRIADELAEEVGP